MGSIKTATRVQIIAAIDPFQVFLCWLINLLLGTVSDNVHATQIKASNAYLRVENTHLGHFHPSAFDCFCSWRFLFDLRNLLSVAA